MPNIESAKKSLRKAVKLTAKNLNVKKDVKNALKTAKKAIEKEDTMLELVKTVGKKLDKAAQHGPFKKNKAARLKSRLMKQLNKTLKK